MPRQLLWICLLLWAVLETSPGSACWGKNLSSDQGLRQSASSVWGNRSPGGQGIRYKQLSGIREKREGGRSTQSSLSTGCEPFQFLFYNQLCFPLFLRLWSFMFFILAAPNSRSHENGCQGSENLWELDIIVTVNKYQIFVYIYVLFLSYRCSWDQWNIKMLLKVLLSSLNGLL